MKKKKILFAAVDVGYRIELYTQFIKQYYSNQLDPESLSTYVVPKVHYITSYTYEYNFHSKSDLYRWYRSVLNFIFCLFRYDIFHFISGETLLTRKLRWIELKIYKFLNKRVIMHFVGADIRSLEFEEWKGQNIQLFIQGQRGFPKSLPWQKKMIHDAEKYANSILVSTPDLLDLIPSAIYYPVQLNLNKFLQELNDVPRIIKNPDEIVILHSPSNSKYKGTNYIHEILKKIQLNSAYHIRLILPSDSTEAGQKIYSVSRYELFKLYKESDIVIDQLITGWYGLQSIEALSAGNMVVCYVDEDLKQYLHKDSPIEIADINTLEEVIYKCIRQISNGERDLNRQIGWVRKYHTIEENHQALLDAWGLRDCLSS